MARLIRIVNPNELRPAHIVMLGLFFLALAGNCLLTSAGKPVVLHDGANEWDPDSLLLSVVEILDLQYAQPTPNGTAIKSLVAGTASGVGIFLAMIGLWLRSRDQDAPDDVDTVIEVDQSASAAESPHAEHPFDAPKKHLDPILGSQVLMLLYVLWAFASILWSHAPAFSSGAAIILGINVLWAFALAYGLNRRAAAIAGYMLVGVLVVTGVLAILYHQQRNPNLRASYPLGNPLILSACLMPGVLLAIACVLRGVAAVRAKQVSRGIGFWVIFGLGATAMLYAFYLTNSRGPGMALGVGLVSILAFAGGRDAKLVAAVVGAIGIAVVGMYFVNLRDTSSATGRTDSMRVRFYTWNYAMDMVGERPLTGQGAGTYALLADGIATADVLTARTSLNRRISHAHSEWLEVAGTLGGIGLVLVLGSLMLAVLGGAKAIPDISDPVQKWVLIGLCSALVALVCEECFGVGLRITGLPFVFFTVVGLVWGLARPVPDSVPLFLSRHRWVRRLGALGIAVLAMGAAEWSRRDFSAARSLFDIKTALSDSDWDEADRLSSNAFEYRLRPQRKLIALFQKIRSKLYSAEQLQRQYLRRLSIQSSGPPGNALLEKRTEDDRALSEEMIEQAFADLALLRSVCSSEMGVGTLEYGLRQLRAVYATVDERAEDASNEHIMATKAIAAQLERQPFEPELAARWVRASMGSVEVTAGLEAMARPLRMNSLSPSYLEVLSVLAQTEAYQSAGAAMIESALSNPESVDSQKRMNRWSPEVLRLGAVVAYAKNQHAESVKYLQEAVRIYEDAPRIPLLARASCYAELADALFFASPQDPQLAIKAAESSLTLAPRSQLGRRLTSQLTDRILAYHLAADHESFVKEKLLERSPNLEPEQLNRNIARRYVEMAYSVFGTALERIPYKLNGWSQRAIELDPNSAPTWFLAADISLHVRDEKQTVERINRAIEHGGDPQDIYSIVLRAQIAMPTSQVIAGMRSHIEREIGISNEAATPVVPPSAAEPTEPNPAP
ncbi:MAG: hypothetical protein GXP29_04645 [Planctomycetes bacterium]|nr:hypothetical protein [Planctomycetota bacterium]